MTRIYLSQPDVGQLEREALLRAFDSGWVAPAGPELVAFEADIAAVTGWPGAVAMSSGSAALHLALHTSGVGPDDRVIVSSFTFAASANAVAYCGAQPVFVDSESTSWNISPQLLADELAEARRLNQLPKAVVVVDLYGQCADYDLIAPQCAELGIPLIEDAAEALGATYRGRPAGTLGDAGVLSFNGNKIMTTSGGGMYLSPDAAMADRVRHLATQARLPTVHYEHTEIGYNYRLSNLLAAVGRVQLRVLPARVSARREVFALYERALEGVSGVSLQPEAPWGVHARWLSCITFDPRLDRVAPESTRIALSARGIETRPLWKPMHRQPVYQRAGYRVVGGAVADGLFRDGLCLPSSSSLSRSDVSEVADAIREVLLRAR